MKKVVLFLLIAVLFLGLAQTAMAQDKATKEEAEVKVNEAVQLAVDKGLDEALIIVADKNGPFVWKDSYVFAIDADTQLTAVHPMTPTLVGKNLMGVKDVNGKLFFAEMTNVAKEKGEGWVTYMWPKPGEKTASSKESYVKIVPGSGIFFGAGVYK